MSEDGDEVMTGEALAAVFSPALVALGFRLVDVSGDGVRYDGEQVRFQARFVPRDGELAVYVIPLQGDERFDLLLYLRAIGSAAAASLGDAVADSGAAAIRIAAVYAAALPEVAGLLAGDPVELARARGLRWWNVSPD